MRRFLPQSFHFLWNSYDMQYNKYVVLKQILKTLIIRPRSQISTMFYIFVFIFQYINNMISKILTQTISRAFCAGKVIEAPKRFSQTISKARPLMGLYKMSPVILGRVSIAPNATIVGDVFLGENISIGHGTIIRGDINSVKIHYRCAIGDNCVLHTAASSPSGLPSQLNIEGDSVIQSGCTLYSCGIGQKVFVGANSVILEGAILERGAVILPNSVVPPGRVVPAQQVWGGNPIKYIRAAKEQETFVTKNFSKQLIEKTQQYNYQFLPYNNAYLYKPTNPNDEKITSHDIVAENSMMTQIKYDQDSPTTNV